MRVAPPASLGLPSCRLGPPTPARGGDNPSGHPPPLPPSPVSPLYISENQSLKGGTMIRAKFFQKILPEKSKLSSAPFSKKKFPEKNPEI